MLESEQKETSVCHLGLSIAYLCYTLLRRGEMHASIQDVEPPRALIA